MASKFDITQFQLKDPRKDLNTLAHYAEDANRFEDMTKFMHAIATLVDFKEHLTTEERSLLSVAYKNAVGSRRAAWRNLHSILEYDNEDERPHHDILRNYCLQLAAEMEFYALDLLQLLEKHLIPFAQTNDEELLVFYNKMAGDYYRYLSEAIKEKGYDKKALQHYGDAMQLAEAKLASTNSLRLGLLLNYSVFNYEILKDHARACELAKKGCDEAEIALNSLDEVAFQEIKQIMHLLRDNLSLWTHEAEKQKDLEKEKEQS